MAKKVITLLTDDLDGGEADRTVEFALEGVSSTIDLSDANAGRLRKDLDPYLSVATRIGRNTASARGATQPSGGRQENQAIREWALANGYQLSDRGRIPGTIIEAYRTAQ